MGRFSALERMGGDLRYAVRQLVRRPAWTLVVVLTLALGIGANTAIFTLVDTMLFKPAPWRTGNQLVWIASASTGSGRVSYRDYLAYRDRATTLSGVLAYGGGAMSVGSSSPQRVLGGLVSGNYFDVLGVRAAIGRTVLPSDDGEPGAHAVAVLSHAFWRKHFGASPQVLGRVVAINGHPFTIVGVAPPGFTGVAFANDAEQLWVPLAMQGAAMPTRPGLLTAANADWLRAAGRLRDGATVADAAAEMDVIGRQLSPAGTPSEREKGIRVTAMRGGMTPWEQRDLAPVFGLIAIVPALVLLVACTNVANVLMARNVSRTREFAMRRAIGASRGQLIRLLLTESLVLALLSAAAGFTVSFGLIAVISHYGDMAADVPGLLTPDARALVATTTLAIVTTVVFGLAPALTATKFDLLPALKGDGWTSTAASGRTRLRRIFVIAQVAVSLALLIAAGLFLQSLSKAMRVDLGFEPRGVVTVSFAPDLQGYTVARRNAFLAQLLERASAIPGATSAAVTGSLPLSGRTQGGQVVTESAAAPAHVTVASASPRFFETLRVPLVRGRDFSTADTADAALVAIVNETLVRRLWPDGDPIGQRLRGAGATEPWRDVIGVVRDAKSAELTESPRGAYYVPVAQHVDSPLSLVVRTAGDPAAALASITEIVRGLDRDLPLFQAQTLEEGVRQSVTLQRASASLFGVFGGLALLLAAIGVYGVAAHSVSLRTREVGIRMSLGAGRTDVLRMFVRESVSLSLIGVAIGLGISAAASKLLTSFLFGLRATDTMTFAGAAAILCLVTVGSSYLPARRAASIDPIVALRAE